MIRGIHSREGADEGHESLQPVAGVVLQPGWRGRLITNLGWDHLMRNFLTLIVFLAALGAGSIHADWEEDDSKLYRVVVNHEQYYAIWPLDRDIPLTWQAVGFQGTKQQCQEYIQRAWMDLKPRSTQPPPQASKP